jgi:hypothetical protein
MARRLSSGCTCRSRGRSLTSVSQFRFLSAQARLARERAGCAWSRLHPGRSLPRARCLHPRWLQRRGAVWIDVPPCSAYAAPWLPRPPAQVKPHELAGDGELPPSRPLAADRAELVRTRLRKPATSCSRRHSPQVVTVAPSGRRPPEADDLAALGGESWSGQRRRQVGIAGGLALLAALAFGAYSLATGTGPNRTFARGPLSPAAAAACSGPVTPVVSAPTGLNNARALGRVLWLSTVFYGAKAPTQVWINAWRSTTVPRVVLRSWRCSDGRLLHFWFPPPGPGDYSGSAAAMESQAQQQAARAAARLERGGGSLTATLRPRALSQGLPCGTQPPTPGRPRAATPCALDGLFMFSSSGKWVVQAQHSGKIVGTAVFDLHG